MNPVIATRAYGDDPSRVTSLGLAALEGFRAAGVTPVVKHFPGHGATRADSHLALPVVRRSASEIADCEVAPFRAAVAAGIPAAMTAHVAYPDATPGEERDYPATYSHYWVGKILRGELGFSGVVFSDALEMVGARAEGGEAGTGPGSDLEARVERCLQVGVDLLLFDELENGLRALAHLSKLANDSRWQDTLSTAFERVGRFRCAFTRRASAAVHPAAALRLARDRLSAVQRRAIALVGDPGRNLPLAGDRPLCFALPRALDHDRRLDSKWLGARLSECFPGGRVLEFDPGPDAPEALRRGVGSSSETLILGCLGRGSSEWIGAAARAVGDGPGVRIGVALHRPADILELPAGWTRLVSYGFGPVALSALIEVLAGIEEPRGEILGLGGSAASSRRS
jgi:beta-N-acetylhexosaminidase